MINSAKWSSINPSIPNSEVWNMRSRQSKSIPIIALMLLAVLSSVSPVEAVTEASSEELKQRVRWRVCHEDVSQTTGVVFECARIRVPLDYDQPRRHSIRVELIRIPASDAESRQGSILLNPGGPGGSGIDFVLGFGPFVGRALGPDVPAQFDIVGFDPRGIARSTPVRCFSTVERALAIKPPIAFPITADEEELFKQSDHELASACWRRGQARRIGQHMSTANVARDMDVIRASLGDEFLNYLGLSYGTYLGATYANLFPDRVRSVVVDGVLDPIAWVNAEKEVPFTTRLRSDKGAAETLEEFFAQCEAAATGNCALAPKASERFAAVADSLLEEPIAFVDPETGETLLLQYQDAIAFTLASLYSPFGYAELAGLVAVIESATATPEEVGRSVAAVESVLGRQRYENVVEGFPAVACTDSSNPRSYDVWSTEGAAADAEFGYFGRLWTWASSPCARWPFRDRDRYQGPFDATTANPVLVIGNLYDPATRYEGAQTLRSILPNSALLTVDAPGHTSLGISACAGFIVGQYFLDPTVAGAVDGVTCPAEFNAFDIVALPPATAGSKADAATEAATADSDAASMVEMRNAIMDEVGMVPPAVAASAGP